MKIEVSNGFKACNESGCLPFHKSASNGVNRLFLIGIAISVIGLAGCIVLAVGNFLQFRWAIELGMPAYGLSASAVLADHLWQQCTMTGVRKKFVSKLRIELVFSEP